MGNSRLVRAGNKGRRPIPRPHILKRGYYIDLTDHPLAGIGLAKGHIAARDMTAAVDADIPAGAAQIEQGLVQRQAVVGIDPAAHVLDPRRMVDMALKNRAGFDDILKIDPVGVAVGMGLNATNPLAGVLAGAAAAPSLF